MFKEGITNGTFKELRPQAKLSLVNSYNAKANAIGLRTYECAKSWAANKMIGRVMLNKKGNEKMGNKRQEAARRMINTSSSNDNNDSDNGDDCDDVIDYDRCASVISDEGIEAILETLAATTRERKERQTLETLDTSMSTHHHRQLTRCALWLKNHLNSLSRPNGDHQQPFFFASLRTGPLSQVSGVLFRMFYAFNLFSFVSNPNSASIETYLKLPMSRSTSSWILAMARHSKTPARHF